MMAEKLVNCLKVNGVTCDTHATAFSGILPIFIILGNPDLKINVFIDLLFSIYHIFYFKFSRVIVSYS